MINVYFEPNPLNIHELRRLTVCPEYFTPVDFEMKSKPDFINCWIYKHLRGRFFSGNWVKIVDGKSCIHYRVSFESAGEAMYFLLALPDINKFSI